MNSQSNSSHSTPAKKPILKMEIHPNKFPLRESQVTIIIELITDVKYFHICISPNTYLITDEGSPKSKLLHAENITVWPNGTLLPIDKTHTFVLIFGALPKSCKFFEVVMKRPDDRSTVLAGFKRNEADIYRV